GGGRYLPSFPTRRSSDLIALNEASGSGDAYRFYTTERSLTSLPGHVVAYSAPNTQRYIGNPSICILPNGDYLASHDFFGPGAVRSEEHTSELQSRENIVC